MVAGTIRRLLDAREVHIRGIAQIIDSQLDPSAADNINKGGGASAVFDRVTVILRQKLKLAQQEQP
jgi:hypothetical protein